MKQLVFVMLIMLGPCSVYAQDDVVPVAVPPVPSNPQTEVQKPGTEARAKANVEWMYNNFGTLEAERIQCLLHLNRSYLDSFAFAEPLDANIRLKLQQKAVEQRETALKDCLGDRWFEVLKELREKNNYTPGSAAKALATAPPDAQPAIPAKLKKGKSAPVAVPATEAVPPTLLSDALEGELQP